MRVAGDWLHRVRRYTPVSSRSRMRIPRSWSQRSGSLHRGRIVDATEYHDCNQSLAACAAWNFEIRRTTIRMNLFFSSSLPRSLSLFFSPLFFCFLLFVVSTFMTPLWPRIGETRKCCWSTRSNVEFLQAESAYQYAQYVNQLFSSIHVE